MDGYPFQVEMIEASFGAVVTDVDLPQIDDRTFAELKELWLDRGLLVFPGQHLSRDEQISFAERFGPLEITMAAISNVKEDGSLRVDDDSDNVMKVLKGNMGWHHDSTYMPVQATGAVFCAETVPTVGGATGFADMRAAYDELDDEMRDRIDGLTAYHSLYHSQAKVGHDGRQGSHDEKSADGDLGEDDYGGYGFHDGPISRRPLVKVHPETGRKNLLVGRHAYGVDGLSDEESEQLLTDLVDFACQAPRTYHHDWEPGDAVLWDNRRLMHQATPWDVNQARVMWHTRIAGNPETESALA